MDRVRVRAWVGTVGFLVLAPGVVAGLVPGLITGWRIPWTGGWASPVAIGAGIVLLAVVVFVLGYEEPTLELEYGDEYREYRRNVRGWLPRVRPWDGAA